MLLLERFREVGDGRSRGDQLVGIDPDADIAIQVTHRLDLADARDGLEHVFDLVAGDVGQELPGEGPGKSHRHDGLIVGVALRHDRRRRTRRKLSLDLGNFGLRVLQRQVDVARQIERRGDARGTLARRGTAATTRPKPGPWRLRFGLMMPVSTSSGDPPGHDTLTVTVGLSTSGNWLTPMRVTAMRPKRIVPNISIHASTGRRRQTSVMFTGSPGANARTAPVPDDPSRVQTTSLTPALRLRRAPRGTPVPRPLCARSPEREPLH